MMIHAGMKNRITIPLCPNSQLLTTFVTIHNRQTTALLRGKIIPNRQRLIERAASDACSGKFLL
jgi:hypothetical protein